MKKTLTVTGAILGTLFASSQAFAATSYQVNPGDTLSNIANHNHTTVGQLKTLNHINSNLIFPGQMLKVNNGTQTYIVQPGDALSVIAEKYSTSVDHLVQLNPEIANPNFIVIGQTIHVNSENIYKVQLGDSLSSISKAHHTTVDFLLALNPEITNANQIHVGQMVKVSGNVINGPKTTHSTSSSDRAVQSSVTSMVSRTSRTVPPTQKTSSTTKIQTPVASKAQTTVPVQAKAATRTQVSKPVHASAIRSQVSIPVHTSVEKTQATAVQTHVSAPAQAPAQTKKTNVQAAPSSATLADRVIAAGEKYLGTRYQYGASTIRTDVFDCSSFTYRAFKEGAGITLPRTSAVQATIGTPVSLNTLQKGDLIFFDTDFNGTINHVGIYVGNGQMLNAPIDGVSFDNITGGYWKERMVKAVRVLK